MFNFIQEFYKLLSKKEKKQYFNLQILVLLMAIFETISVFSIGPFLLLISNYDQAVISQFIFIDLKNYSYRELILTYGSLLFFILLISVILSIYTISSMIKFGYFIGSSFSIKLFKYYLSRDWYFFVNSDYTKLIKNISQECDRVSEGIIKQVFVINARIVTAIIISIGLFIYNYILASTAFLIFFISYFAIYNILKKYLTFHGENIKNKQTQRYSLMYESFRSFKEILLYDLLKKNNNNFEKYSSDLAASRSTVDLIAYVPKYFIEFVGFTSVIIISIIITVFAGNDFSELIILLSIYAFATFKILPAFQSIYICIAQIKSNLPAFNSIIEDLKLYNNEKKNDKNFKKILDDYSFEKEILVKNISYSFQNKKNIFRNLSFNIKKNSKIGIIGQTGIGKSTLTLIISGLVKPNSGNIYVDDIKLNYENCKNWQKNISVVDQNTYLFNGTIKDNITLKDADSVNYNKLEEVIEYSQLGEFINTLPQKINTIIGQDASKISTGQKQRIGIARALYRNTNLIIMDEATSNLDKKTEEKLFKQIKNINKTIILISHKKLSLDICNEIFEIKNQSINKIN